MYKKVDTSLNFAEREKEILDFWKQNKIFEKSVDARENGKEFCFYDAHGKRQAARRARFNPCYERHYSPL